MTHRPLRTIAGEIEADWKTGTSTPAWPYLFAMTRLDSIDDTYGCDSAKSIVFYFLSNAASWRGETARRIKDELKRMTGVR